MAAVEDRRIGVWFSVALVIFALSAWPGWKLGVTLAVHRYSAHQSQPMGTLSAHEHAHLESVLDELDRIGILRLFYIASASDDNLRKNLPAEMWRIENFRRRVNTAEAKPVIDMNLALADVLTAITDEQTNNNEQAAKYMRSAQSLYQSLGWKDFSEDTLKVLAKREQDRWMPNSEAIKHAK